MRSSLLACALCVCGSAAAQDRGIPVSRQQFTPQPSGPVQMLPVQIYAPYQLMQVGEPQYVPMQPRQPRRPRGVWGWGPFPLGYCW